MSVSQPRKKNSQKIVRSRISKKLSILGFILSLFLMESAYAKGLLGYAAPSAINDANTPSVSQKPVKPFRTFLQIQRYSVDNNGEATNPISNVRLEITFPNGSKISLPEGGQYWPIGNGQVQEINRTFEIPWAFVEKDGFKFSIQMIRKGSEMLPCNFEVRELSQFNRAYTCHTDTSWQAAHKVAEDKLDREGIQIRIFTELNSKPSEIPNDVLALKP